MKITNVCILLILILFSCTSPTTSTTSSTTNLQVIQKTLATPVDTASHYLLYLPPDYGKDTNKTWPLMIFLHGSQAFSYLTKENLSQQGILGYMQSSGDRLPAIVVQPQQDVTVYPIEGNWHDPAFLDAVIKEVESQYSVDLAKVSITGGSLGGFGSWYAVLAFPHRFSAVMPVVGGLSNDSFSYNQHVSLTTLSDWGNSFQNITVVPMKVGIGLQDANVELSMARNPVNFLKSSGGNPDSQEYSANHGDTQTIMFCQSNFQWMLNQTNSSVSEDPQTFTASDYVGNYSLGTQAVTLTSDGKRLILHYSNGNPDVVFYCVGTDRFVSGWLMVAVRNSGGQVVKFTTPVGMVPNLIRQ